MGKLRFTDNKQVYFDHLKITLFAIHQKIVKLKWSVPEDETYLEDFYYTLIKMQNVAAVFQEKEMFKITLFMIKQFDKEGLRISVKEGQERILFKGLISLLKLFNNKEERNNFPIRTLPQQNDPKRLIFIIVDHDYPFAQALYEELLEYKVTCFVYNKEIAPNEIVEKNPDLLMVNMLLPDQQGIELVKAIRNHEVLKGLPILAITHSKDEQLYKKILESGIDNILYKPFSTDILLGYGKNMIKRLANRNHKLVDYPQVHKNELGLLLQKEWNRFIRFSSEFCLIYLFFDPKDKLAEEKVAEFHKNIYLLYELLKNPLRKYDDIKIYDVNKILVLLPNTQLDVGNLVAQRLTKLIRESKVGKKLYPWLKIGVLESDLSFDNELKMVNLLQDRIERKTTPYGFSIYSLLNRKQENILIASKKNKILIVDDDPISASLIMNHFSKEQWELEVCIEVKNAIEKALTFKPDFILSETKMDDLDGFFFCQKVSQFPQLKDTKFYFLTKQTLHHYMVRAYEVGCDDYITKPFSVEVLEAKLKRL